jgi:hypothetical protein
MVASISVWDDILKPCIPPVVIAALGFLVSLVPRIGPYLLWHLRLKIQIAALPQFHTWTGVAAELPLWAWLPLPLIPWTVWTLVRRLRSHPPAPQPRVTRASVGGLEWDVLPDFFENYHDVEDPSLGAFSIRGPYCIHCKGSLHLSDHLRLGDDYKPIPNPCPSCGKSHATPSNVSVLDAKSQAYRELQRQVRAGQLRPPTSP